jgi:hypothetical protein
MSLDLSIAPNSCKHCGKGDDTLEFNYTYNVSQMWYEIYPDDEGMVQLDGMTGQEAAPKIQKAIEEMLSKPAKMKKFQPANGWGSYEGFLQFLKDVLEACKECPDGVWRSFR